jgi:Ca-activated chloride channel homolog
MAENKGCLTGGRNGRKNMRTWITRIAAAGAAALVAAGAGAKAPEIACRIETDRGILPADRTEKAVIKVTLDAPQPPDRHERPAVNLCIVLDRSGSMTGDKIEKARDAAIAALRKLGERDYFSLVIYDHEVETLVPAQRAENAEWIEGRIRSITARGNTALYGGVSQGASEIRKHLGDGFVSRLILLSDGLANVGPSSPEELGRLGTSLRKENIAVTTIGMGTDYNEDLMARLARESDGNTYFVENSSDLARIFSAELGDVLSVVAKEVKITIECTGDVKPLRVIGRDGRIDGTRIELGMNQLYGGQEKYVLVEVEVPPTAEGKKRQVATARCEYQNLLTQQPCKADARAEVAFSRSEDKVVDSFNAPVQREMLLNYAAEAKDRGIELNDAGQHGAAAKYLRENAVQLRAYGMKAKDEVVLKEAEQLDSQASQAADGPLPTASRKLMRAQVEQAENQQSLKQ